jgi:hypothetical protein
MLQAVLYGIFPIVLGGGALSFMRLRLMRRPLTGPRGLAHASTDPASQNQLKDIYRWGARAGGGGGSFIC